MFYNIYKAVKILKEAINFFFISRKHFTSIPNSEATRTSSTFQQVKPGWTYKNTPFSKICLGMRIGG